MRQSTLFLFAVLWGLSRLNAQPAEPAFSDLSASLLPDLPSRSWGADQQVIQADKHGRVAVLRRTTLEVYELTGSGKLLAKGRLGKDRSFSPKGYDARAVMSPDGDEWVVYTKPNYLYIFQGDEMTAIEAPWEVSGLAADGGDLLLALAPAEMTTTSPSMLRLTALPLLQQWDGSRWSTLVEGPFPWGPPEGVNSAEFMRSYSALLALTPEHKLWMANEFAYHLRRFSPSGALQEDLTVGGGKVVWSERTEEEWAKAEAAAKKGGMAGWSRRSLSPVRAETALRGMTVGRDGAVYLLAETKQGLALDRYQPYLLSLDRVLLKGIEPPPGRLTLAAGKEGLYIAGFAGRDGIWRIDSEDLEKADWKPVPGAVLNGQPLVPLTEAKPQKALRTKDLPKAKTEPSPGP